MRPHARTILLVIACAIGWGTLLAQQPAASEWRDWSFLLGEWKGEGGGEPGQGIGGFTFKPDLQQSVLVRTSYSEYPASKDRPAYRHDDLMVIYREKPSSPVQAMYFDNEGHVIHYGVTIDSTAKTAVFLSQPENGAPRYRLTYTAKAPDTVSIKFEVAPPDKPEQFKTFIEARATRISK